MRPNFYTRDELSKLSLEKLRLIDISDKDEEDLVQEFVLLKQQSLPPVVPVDKSDVPDIKTVEEEIKWQKILDAREEALRPKISVKSDESGIDIQVNQPVEQPIEEPVNQVVEQPKVKCEQCGKELKNDFALRMHKGKFHKSV